MSSTSSSHLGRVERGERFPSASVLRRMARPLGFEESELFCLAGYLSLPSAHIETENANRGGGRLDPYVRTVLSQEPIAMQRTLVGVLSILKGIAKTME